MKRILGWMAALVTVGLVQAAEVPASGVISMRDHGYRDWGPEVVNYQVDTARFVPGKLALLDEDGRAVPFQIEEGRLRFVATLPQGELATWRLTASPADRSGENSDLRWQARANDIELRNGLLGLRLQLPGEHRFEPAIPLRDVPPPILQWANLAKGETWMGSARFAGEETVSSAAFSLLSRGPAVVDYEARYRFTDGGEYVCRVQLGAGMPIAKVSEEFDLKRMTDGDNWLLLNLHEGWQPDFVGLEQGQNEQQLPILKTSGFASLQEAKAKAGASAAPVGGVGEAPRTVPPEAGMVLLADHVPAGKWGGKSGGIQVWQGDEKAPQNGLNMALTLLHAGSWRRANALHSWFQGERGIVVSLPIGTRYIRWSIDIADDFSPFSTHEHDRGLSPTYGRREWGLYVGAAAQEAQARHGYIGLDRYKEWTLTWPDTVGAKAYPGGFFLPAHVEKLRQTLDQHPDAEYLKTWYLFSGKTEDAVRHAEAVIANLKKPYQENDFYIAGLSNYRKSQFLTFVNEAEDALACFELPAELRTELRTRLALYAYITSDPDFNPRGSGVHLGNNNMTINRTLALTYFAGLLPDHPRYAYWMDRAARFARFKFATQTAPDGTWVACPTYQLYSPARTLNVTQTVMRNRGIETFSRYGYEEATLRYVASLLVADRRFPVGRILPGMGNSPNQQENIWGFSMAAFDPEQPAVAADMRGIWEVAVPRPSFLKSPNHHDGRTPHPLWFLPAIAANPPRLATSVRPAYGMVFRDGFGTPGETTMLFRAGVNWSHWDTDSFNVILYAEGDVPLSPGTGYQYISHPMTQDTGIYHNRVKVGERDAQIVFGRVDASLRDYALDPVADYAMAEHFYPAEIFKSIDQPLRWRREILFVKRRGEAERSYFAMRDSFPDSAMAPTWWTWMTLGEADRISVDGVAFDPATVPHDKVVPVAEMPVLKGQSLLLKTEFGTHTWIWFNRPVEVRLRMTATYTAQDGNAKETKSIIEIPGAPGEDFFYVVYPLKDGEQPPVCAALHADALRVTTAAGNDFIVLAPEPRTMVFENPGRGQAGTLEGVTAGVLRVDRETVERRRQDGVTSMRHVRPAEQTVALGDSGIEVRGEGPFTAELQGQTVVIRSSGRARLLHVTKPAWMIRPQYRVDGQEWMACWTDYPASGWGTYANTHLVALSVPAGEHELRLADMVFPRGWERPFQPAIEGAVVENGLDR